MMRGMEEGRSWYRLFDPAPALHGCEPITDFKTLTPWNEKKWGIFWTVNRFEGPRVKANLKEIISWAVDIDEGTKAAQIKRIKSFIRPSLVIETKRGFQVYYDAIDATVDGFKETMTEHLIPNLIGDKNAADLCRILRAPFFNHWKDESDPFECRSILFDPYVRYSEAEIRKYFPKIKAPVKHLDEKASLSRDVSFTGDQTLFERIYMMDCEDALNRLSGTEAVGYEVITFSRVSRGRLNIIVNGKGTSCFIDENKRIGSRDSGGPTPWQFINWYHHDHKVTYSLFKKYFPEVCKK